MGWIKHPGISGKVYVPEFLSDRHKKHACRDCYGCLQCGDDRCAICRQAKPQKSLAESAAQRQVCKTKQLIRGTKINIPDNASA